MRSYFAALFAALLLPLAAHAQQPGMRAQVLIVESLPAFERWAQTPPPPGSTYPASLREVPVGKPVHFPIVVSGLRPGARELNVVADIEFFAPNGNSLGVIQQCCRFSAPANSDTRMAVLGNAATLVFAANDMRGTYTVAVSATDGASTVTARETFRFGPAEAQPTKAVAPPAPVTPPAASPPKAARTPPPAAPAPSRPAPPSPVEMPSSAAEAPKLRMGTPPENNPGRDGDRRDCLALPTPAEIIKCAEKKK